MKTLLIIDAGLGQARAYMAKTLLGAAAPKAHLELIDNPNDAELVIVLGAALPTDSALNGKQVYLGDINRAVGAPGAVPQRSQRSRNAVRGPCRCGSPGGYRRTETYCRGHGLPDRRCSYLYGGRSHRNRSQKTRLVGEGGNPRLRRGWQCHHPGRGGRGGSA